MKYNWVSLCGFIGVIGLLVFSFVFPSTPAQAGGLPCFLCHGDNFQGTDIAPRLAGTKLNDGEIYKQIQSPRGVMPAFPDYAQPWVIEVIRNSPEGRPTRVLPPEQKSMALATISAVAAARATTVLQTAQSIATPAPVSVANVAKPSEDATTKLTEPARSAPLGIFAWLSGVVVLSVGLFWVMQRRV